ncbi:MAG: protein kinase [Polyangiaceae bacterium]
MTTEARGPNLEGAVLSRRFRLVKRLGEGGMGVVYAAESLADGRKVALKILREEFLSEPTVLQRFLDEGRTCQKLAHPNIVTVFETAQAEDGSPYIVMELLEGIPLSAYTANGGRIAVLQAVPIVHGILNGLAAAHAQGIIHRDLKPDNVFLSRDAKGQFVVKLLDFGIAKVMDVAGGMGNKTKTGMLLGTPAYMSPEHVKNAKDVDARTDLWSVGVMFYEMITGRVAFPAPTEYARLTAVLTTQPDAVERIDPNLAPYSAFISQAMQKDRSLRFQSALGMGRALAMAGNDEQSAVRVAVLSRLPEVPAVYAPPSAVAAARPSQPPEGTGGHARMPSVPPPTTPGGTLTSPRSRTVSEHPPAVVMVQAPSSRDGTLPSEHLPMVQKRGFAPARVVGGVPPVLVVVLVLLALLAGFLLGFATARHT